MSLELKAFARAKDEIAAARSKLEAMKSATRLDAVVTLWSEFLTLHQRSFTKLRKAAEKGPSKGWFDSVLNRRKGDELLNYLHHARNADEHGIEDITKKTDTSRMINPRDRSKPLIIENLRIDSNRIFVDKKTAESIEITIIPGGIDLVRLLDRGIWYDPPTTHLGESLQNTSILTIAEHALVYVERLIAEAEEKFS